MFSLLSLQDLGNEDWIMDTGATYHVHANEGILKTLGYNISSNSVLVGNGSQIPLIKTAHSPFLLNNLFCPLHLNNILNTPNIKKKSYICSQICLPK